MVVECDAFILLTSTNNNKRSYLFNIYVITLSDTKYVIIAIVKKIKKTYKFILRSEIPTHWKAK